MKGRYEIKDRNNPKAKGYRFTKLEHAQRELAHATPPERWYIFDRAEGKEV